MADNAKVEVKMSEQEKAWVNGGKTPEPKAVEAPAKEETLPPMKPIEEGEVAEETGEVKDEKITPSEEAKEEPEIQAIDIEAQVKPIKSEMARLETHASRLTKLADVYKKKIDAGDQSVVQDYNEVVKEYNDIAKEYGEMEKTAVGIQEKGQAVNMLTDVFNNTPKELKTAYKTAFEQAIKMTPFTGSANTFVDNVLRHANRLLDAKGLKKVEAVEETIPAEVPAEVPVDESNAKKIIKKVGTVSGKTTGNAQVEDLKSLKEKAASGDKEALRKIFSRGDPIYQKLKAGHR
jgi:hypothetical protein